MNLNKLANRPHMYLLEDGLAEMAIGFVSLVAFATFSPSAFRALPLLVPQAIWFGGCLNIFWAAKKLKERVTFPRGGYVAIEEPAGATRGRTRRALSVALAFGIIWLIAVFRDVSPSARALAVVAAAVFFAAYTFGAMKYRVRHMWWLATFSALLGLWVYERDGSPGDSLAFVILGQGVALVVSGGVRLWQFLKSHPRPSETGA